MAPCNAAACWAAPTAQTATAPICRSVRMDQDTLSTASSVSAEIVHEAPCHGAQLGHCTAGHLLDLLHVLLGLQPQKAR